MSDIWEGFADSYDADARLTILKALYDDPGKTLHHNLLLQTMKGFGFRRGIGHLQTQLSWLELQGALKLHRAGSVVVAELTQKGADHLTRDNMIVGIKQPSLAR